jgi:hypothetical protein
MKSETKTGAMGLLTKLRPSTEAETASRAHAANGAENLRASNGLKEFLRHLGSPEDARLLDLGPVSQATVDFFTGRRYKVYTNDLLRAWNDFLAAELAAMMAAKPGATDAGNRPDPAERAARFVRAVLDYPAESFHGVLAWDVADYLPPEVVRAFVARLHELVRPGGAVLAIFHSRAPERSHRYRVLNAEGVECLPATVVVPFGKVLPNRDILNLFSMFRSSKTFVGRDQIREALFTR